MADEAAPTNDGSLESAVAALGEARKEAASEKFESTGKIELEGHQGAPTATDDTPRETPAPEQVGEDEQVDHVAEDADQESPIDPPARWTAEDKEWFRTLPPDRQERILRGEQGQRAAEVKRQQELAVERQRLQDETQQAAQERQYLQSTIQHYKHPVENAFRQQFADVIAGQTDLFRLAQDQQRWPIYQAFQAEFQRIGMAETQLAQRAEAEEQSRLSQHIEARNNRLLEARPDLKDQAKFEQFDAEVTNYLRGYNVPDERIARVSYEELEIAEKAMLWDKAQKAKAAAPKAPQPKPGQIPVTGHVRTLPGRVLKPGSPNSGGALDDKIAAITQRARQSGSTEDAAERLRLARERITRRA